MTTPAAFCFCVVKGYQILIDYTLELLGKTIVIIENVYTTVIAIPPN